MSKSFLGVLERLALLETTFLGFAGLCANLPGLEKKVEALIVTVDSLKTVPPRPEAAGVDDAMEVDPLVPKKRRRRHRRRKVRAKI